MIKAFVSVGTNAATQFRPGVKGKVIAVAAFGQGGSGQSITVDFFLGAYTTVNNLPPEQQVLGNTVQGNGFARLVLTDPTVTATTAVSQNGLNVPVNETSIISIVVNTSLTVQDSCVVYIET